MNHLCSYLSTTHVYLVFLYVCSALVKYFSNLLTCSCCNFTAIGVDDGSDAEYLVIVLSVKVVTGVMVSTEAVVMVVVSAEAVMVVVLSARAMMVNVESNNFD